jgi:hypothetical protein
MPSGVCADPPPRAQKAQSPEHGPDMLIAWPFRLIAALNHCDLINQLSVSPASPYPPVTALTPA